MQLLLLLLLLVWCRVAACMREEGQERGASNTGGAENAWVREAEDDE